MRLERPVEVPNALSLFLPIKGLSDHFLPGHVGSVFAPDKDEFVYWMDNLTDKNILLPYNTVIGTYSSCAAVPIHNAQAWQGYQVGLPLNAPTPWVDSPQPTMPIPVCPRCGGQHALQYCISQIGGASSGSSQPAIKQAIIANAFSTPPQHLVCPRITRLLPLTSFAESKHPHLLPRGARKSHTMHRPWVKITQRLHKWHIPLPRQCYRLTRQSRRRNKVVRRAMSHLPNRCASFVAVGT